MSAENPASLSFGNVHEESVEAIQEQAQLREAALKVVSVVQRFGTIDEVEEIQFASGTLKKLLMITTPPVPVSDDIPFGYSFRTGINIDGEFTTADIIIESEDDYVRLASLDVNLDKINLNFLDRYKNPIKPNDPSFRNYLRLMEKMKEQYENEYEPRGTMPHDEKGFLENLPQKKEKENKMFPS